MFLQKSIAIWLSNPFEVLGSLSVLQWDKVCLPGSLHAAAKQQSTQRPQVPGFCFVFLSTEKSPESIPEWRAASWGVALLRVLHEKGYSMGHITVFHRLRHHVLPYTGQGGEVSCRCFVPTRLWVPCPGVHRSLPKSDGWFTATAQQKKMYQTSIFRWRWPSRSVYEGLGLFLLHSWNYWGYLVIHLNYSLWHFKLIFNPAAFNCSFPPASLYVQENAHCFLNPLNVWGLCINRWRQSPPWE